MVFRKQLFPAGCNLAEPVQFASVRRGERCIRLLSFGFGGSLAAPPSYPVLSPFAYLRALLSQSAVPLIANEVKLLLQPSIASAWTAQRQRKFWAERNV